MLPGREVRIAIWRAGYGEAGVLHVQARRPALALGTAPCGLGCGLAGAGSSGVFERVSPVQSDRPRPTASSAIYEPLAKHLECL